MVRESLQPDYHRQITGEKAQHLHSVNGNRGPSAGYPPVLLPFSNRAGLGAESSRAAVGSVCFRFPCFFLSPSVLFRAQFDGTPSQGGVDPVLSALRREAHYWHAAAVQVAVMKDGMANNSTASISQARKAVEQLKMEACMDRIKVSKAAADLMAYCDAHIREDPLIVPVPASENPFREKKFFCTIL